MNLDRLNEMIEEAWREKLIEEGENPEDHDFYSEILVSNDDFYYEAGYQIAGKDALSYHVSRNDNGDYIIRGIMSLYDEDTGIDADFSMPESIGIPSESDIADMIMAYNGIWDSTDVVWERILAEKTTDAGELERLSRSSDEETVRRVARNEAIPESVQIEIAKGSNLWAKSDLAENATVGADVLDMLAKDPEGWAYERVAKRRDAWEKTYEVLAERHNKYVTELVASNESAPADLLNVLSMDEDEAIRAKVAENSSTSIDTIRRLAEDSSRKVKAAVNRNRSTSVELLSQMEYYSVDPSRDEAWLNISGKVEEIRQPEVLQKLLHGKNEIVAFATKKYIARTRDTNLLDEIAMLGDAAMIDIIIGNEHITDDLLFALSGRYGRAKEKLEKRIEKQREQRLKDLGTDDIIIALRRDKSPKTGRYILRAYHNLPYEALQVLAENEDADVREKARELLQTKIIHEESPETLRKLARIDTWYVRKAVASNPRTPAKTLRKLSEMVDWYTLTYCILENPNTPIDVYERFSESDQGKGIIRMVRSITDKEKLDEYAESPYRYARKAAALNPHTRAETLEELLSDDAPCVRRAAERTLDMI